jgi:hypothetical protein
MLLPNARKRATPSLHQLFDQGQIYTTLCTPNLGLLSRTHSITAVLDIVLRLIQTALIAPLFLSNS